MNTRRINEIHYEHLSMLKERQEQKRIRQLYKYNYIIHCYRMLMLINLFFIYIFSLKNFLENFK